MSVMIPAWVEGRLTPVEKLDAHLRGLRHKAISVFLIAGDRMLLQRRAMGKYHSPGLWANACCTHPNWGENAATCATRRLEEELGLTGLPLQYRCQLEYCAPVGQDMVEHEVVDLFVHNSDREITPRPNPDEVMDTAWVSIGDVARDTQAHPEKYSAWLGIYMRNHADQILAGVEV